VRRPDSLTALLPSCAYCLETWKLQLPGPFWVCKRPIQGLLYLLISMQLSYSVTKEISFKSIYLLSKFEMAEGFEMHDKALICDKSVTIQNL
jgi:hypothetical protein